MIDQPGGFGFVETAKGAIYFHRNSVADGRFEDLEPGREVRLEIAERESGEGWQATTVRPLGRRPLEE
jgi:cold shock CspA family protein